MFSTDGVFLVVSLPPMPTLKATVSAKANRGIWQLAQLTDESFDNIFSENNLLPRAALVFISTYSFSKKELVNKNNNTAGKKKNSIFFINTNLQAVVVKSSCTYKIVVVSFKK